MLTNIMEMNNNGFLYVSRDSSLISAVVGVPLRQLEPTFGWCGRLSLSSRMTVDVPLDALKPNSMWLETRATPRGLVESATHAN